MGAVARSPAALRRLLHIAAVPTAAFLAFAIWWLAGWGGKTLELTHQLCYAKFCFLLPLFPLR